MTSSSTSVVGAHPDTANPLTSPSALLVSATCILAGIGLVEVFNASAYYATGRFGNTFHFEIRHAVGIVLGAVAMIAASRMPARFWLRIAPWVLLLSFVLLIVVLTPVGVVKNNARRWISLGVTGFQPSELAKVAVPLYLAASFGKHQLLPVAERNLAALHRRQFVVVLAAFGLISVQPDFGTATFIAGVGMAMLWISGVPTKRLLLAGLCALPLIVIALITRDPANLIKRFMPLFAIEEVTQVHHSVQAIGAGGFAGQGIGTGAAGFGYVPEAYNDFIFAVIAESTGLVGVLVLLGLFSVILHSGHRIAKSARSPSLRLLAMGLTINLVLQACANIAVATGTAPAKGIGLPFVSYGSTSLLVCFFEVGVLVSIARASRDPSIIELDDWREATAS